MKCRECGKPAVAKGLCHHHYGTTRKATMPPCEVPGCDGPQHARGRCTTHYSRQRRRRAPGAPSQRQVGEDHHMAKLRKQDVLDIRRRFREGERQGALADEFGVSRLHVGSIVQRKVWKHLEEER